MGQFVLEFVLPVFLHKMVDRTNWNMHFYDMGDFANDLHSLGKLQFFIFCQSMMLLEVLDIQILTLDRFSQ